LSRAIGEPFWQRIVLIGLFIGNSRLTAEDLEDFGDTPAGDAVLIGCGHALEHYEIARYGLLKAWAAQLGMAEVGKLLDQTLQEEKKADALLGQIGEKSANAEAKGKSKAA
jgi:ferritin-like metal-binding protein YciE